MAKIDQEALYRAHLSAAARHNQRLAAARFDRERMAKSWKPRTRKASKFAAKAEASTMVYLQHVVARDNLSRAPELAGTVLGEGVSASLQNGVTPGQLG